METRARISPLTTELVPKVKTIFHKIKGEMVPGDYRCWDPGRPRTEGARNSHEDPDMNLTLAVNDAEALARSL